MACEHQHGGLQIPAFRQDRWVQRCIVCGAEEPLVDPGLPEEAGQAAADGLHQLGQHRFSGAAEAFRKAHSLAPDPRFLFAALLCRLGVTWCGNEYQPTFSARRLPMDSLTRAPEWEAITAASGSMSAKEYQAMQATLAQLEEILGYLRANEGRSAADVFICYRRTDAAVRQALRLYRDLTDEGLRVFCADVTTNGKTQEQFESEVWHALQTAEFLVLIPGEGEEALTPWLRNELERAACPADRRMVCTDGCTAMPAEISRAGSCLSMEDIRAKILRAADSCAPDALLQRALNALGTPDGGEAAEGLLRRASARGSQAARLLLAALCGEGLVLPRDEERAALYRRLAGSASDETLQLVNNALSAIEKSCSITRRQALIYLVADVSDAGVKASQTLMRPFVSGLCADRRLAAAQLCVVGYDRHAQVLEEPRELSKYGLPAHAAMTLRTSRENGRDGAAFASRGLRCAADHLRQQPCEGQTPFIVLLRPCLTADAEYAVPAALAMLEAALPGVSAYEIRSIEQLPGCIAAIRQQL